MAQPTNSHTLSTPTPSQTRIFFGHLRPTDLMQTSTLDQLSNFNTIMRSGPNHIPHQADLCGTIPRIPERRAIQTLLRHKYLPTHRKALPIHRKTLPIREQVLCIRGKAPHFRGQALHTQGKAPTILIPSRRHQSTKRRLVPTSSSHHPTLALLPLQPPQVPVLLRQRAPCIFILSHNLCVACFLGVAGILTFSFFFFLF